MTQTSPETANAERSVLGAVLLDGRALLSIPGALRPEDFSGQNAAVWAAIRALAEKNRPVDVLTLSEQLRATGDLERAGGPAYLAALETAVASASNVAHYARIVLGDSMRRRLAEFGRRVIAAAADEEQAVEDVVARAQGEILSLARPDDDAEAVTVKQLWSETLDHVERLANGGPVSGVPTGITDLDAMTGGFQRGELTLLAARPAMGKTAWAVCNAATSAARSGAAVVVFSLEMPRRQLGQRLIAAWGDVSSERVRTGRLYPDEWERVGHAGSRLPAGLWIRDRAGASLFDVRVSCRRVEAREKRPVGLVVVDYVQIMRPTDRRLPREQQVAELSRGLKDLARDMDCPVLALAQLSREAEKRADKRPLLSDLRESGSLEADADVVIGLHREGLYNAKVSPNDAELLVLKNRNGATGTVAVEFSPTRTLFANRTSRPAGDWQSNQEASA